MDELENYECFGVPAHVWLADDVISLAPAAGATRRTAVPGEAAMLGIEAIPSPALADVRPLK
jgi:hypothetical protein